MRIIAAGLLFAITAPAAAQFKDSAGNCFAGSGSFRLDIHECSNALTDPRHTDISRASLLAMRGRAYLESGAPDAAIADFDRALALNPHSAFALTERGRTRHRSGDNETALADFNAALALSPQYGTALRNRGVIRIFTGRFTTAVQDFDAAIAAVSYDPPSHALRGIARYLNGEHAPAAADFAVALEQAYPWPQGMLWLYLARHHAGADGKPELRRYSAELKPGEWPSALIEAFLGDRGVNEAMDAARRSPEPERPRRVTEAGYYLGELARLNGNTETARTLLGAAIAMARPDAIEFAAARQAISALNRKPN